MASDGLTPYKNRKIQRPFYPYSDFLTNETSVTMLCWNNKLQLIQIIVGYGLTDVREWFPVLIRREWACPRICPFWKARIRRWVDKQRFRIQLGLVVLLINAQHWWEFNDYCLITSRINKRFQSAQIQGRCVKHHSCTRELFVSVVSGKQTPKMAEPLTTSRTAWLRSGWLA